MIQKDRMSISGKKPQDELERVLDCIVSYLSVSDQTSNQRNNETTSGKVADVMLGSKSIRHGNAPTDEQRKYMERLIERWISKNEPIDVISPWGALKGYGLDDDRSSVDVMDIMALRRFVDLDVKVRAVYNPGLNVRIMRENVGERRLTEGIVAGFHRKMDTYSRGLDNLCSVLGINDHIAFVDETTLLQEKGMTAEDFLEKSANNSNVLFNYWIASSKVDVSEWDGLPEFKSLQKLGWKGHITPVDRQYFGERVETEHPGATDEEKAHFSCAYLGTAIARYQLQLFQGIAKDSDGTIPPIKASFVPYPKGAPEERKRGRVEYKVKDNKKSNTTVPPWAGFGFIITDGGDTYQPKIFGMREFRSLVEDNYERTVVEIRSSEGNKSQNFRADVLIR